MARALVVVTASLLLGGCSLGDGDADSPLVGPSELATSVTLAASPDQLPRDGSSQSVVTVTVRDASGQPKGGQRLNVSANIGSVSASDIVTGSDGRATFALTAPAAGTVGNVAVVQVIPVGDNADNSIARTLSVMLTGPSNAGAPEPDFIPSPASPEVNQVTVLDASATRDENAPCLDKCTYSWDLGGEATQTGRVITYRFQTARIYNVALTVTDAAGSSATIRKDVTVRGVDRPTVSSITVSPASPVAAQLATFTPTTTVAPGHQIVSYDWSWGDGTTSQTSNASITHTFSATGTFVVTVTVTDDMGQSASATQTVTVGSGVVASFTSSPTAPKTTDTVQFNASDSTAPGGSTLQTFAWDFGDGQTGSGAVTSHQFTTAGAYVVRLTVTDDEGRSATTTRTVTVTAP